MAEPRFRTCKIFKEGEGNALGSGAYGSVYRALCDGLLCAAKIMHPTLVVGRVSKHGQDERLPWKRFEAECKFLCSLRHPNIVQYLDTKLDPDSKQPVLLMELMDESLTRFLDNCKTNLPFHTEVNICHDIALAMSFLHSNDIVHRDLSSNNILMLGDRRAKITDFGMARQFVHKSRSLTMIPGTKEYMPPEVFSEKPSYGRGVDCFSFGVLALQVITRAYPEPAYEYTPVKQGSEEFLKRVLEIYRRQSQIDLAPGDHLLLPVTKECLKDKKEERPNADDISSIVSSLVQTEQYSRSKEQNDPKKMKREKEMETAKITEKSKQDIREIQAHCSYRIAEMEEKYEEVTRQVLAERHNNYHIIGELKDEFALKQKALEEERDEAKRKLKLASIEMAERDETNRRLQLQVKALQRSQKARGSTSEGDSDNGISPDPIPSPGTYSLVWKQREKPAVRPLYRDSSDCVMCSDTLFIKPVSRSRRVYGYHCTHDIWEELPPCLCDGATLARINNTILALGGKTAGMDFLSSIYYLTSQRDKYIWKVADFQLPTRRSNVTAVNTDRSLIVAGGEGESSTLKLVEVMDTGTRSWMTASSLPEALMGSSASFCDGHLFLVGGQTGYSRVEKNWVFTCSIPDLMMSCRVIGQRSKSSKPPINTWKRIVGPPATESTCITVEGNIYIIGGIGEDGKPTTAVYMYREDLKGKPGWTKVGYMTTPRCRCFAIAYNPKKLLVIGGLTNSGKTSSMETTEFF